MKFHLYHSKLSMLGAASLSSLLLTGCFDDAPVPKASFSCPIEAVEVLKVTYQQDKGRYLVFHTMTPGAEKIPNPLVVENLQMAQVSPPSGETTDFAQLSFQKSAVSEKSNSCVPVLEMTREFKIELTAGTSSSASINSSDGPVGGASGSFWAPFLAGAITSNIISNAMQPRGAPAYYLPPPLTQQRGTGNVVTGGVSGQSVSDLEKKYESRYRQAPPRKSGFFSRFRGPELSRQLQQQREYRQSDQVRKKGGFFNRNKGYSPSQKRGFFRKK